MNVITANALKNLPNALLCNYWAIYLGNTSLDNKLIDNYNDKDATIGSATSSLHKFLLETIYRGRILILRLSDKPYPKKGGFSVKFYSPYSNEGEIL
ncbi:MAG: hypothetical protein HOO91_17705 [Bacteroidales bacterium]|nr:hypothetical protein [Bacteroidales bacterium]